MLTKFQERFLNKGYLNGKKLKYDISDVNLQH